MKKELTDLNDEEAFPRFLDCPYDNEIRDHYRELEDGSHVPIRHWCFLGEITYRLVFNRLCLTVKDRRGEEVPTNFHLNSGGPRMFTPGMSNFPIHPNIPKSLTEEGNTIAILYAERHNFMDGTIGFRIEDANRVQVRQIPLDGILLSDRPT